MALKTDYKNDVFAGKRKYNIIENDDGTRSFVDVTVYEEQGDGFGAGDINSINIAVNQNLTESKSINLSSGDYILPSEDYYKGLLRIDVAHETNALILPNDDNHKYDIYNADTENSLLIKKSGGSVFAEVLPESMTRVAFDGIEYRLLSADGSKYKPKGDIKAEDNVARNLLTWNALTTQWEKAEFGQPYDGTHIILPGGTYVEKGAFVGLEGLRLYRQEDGTFSAIPREFEHYLGYVLDADKALIGVYGGVQNSYTIDLAMMQICIGAAGTLRVRQTMGANATGVMWRYKATPWVDGDTEQKGELLGVLTENYDEPNEWHTFTGLINGSTYYVKAFPFLGEMYNSAIGHNEYSIILQALESHHTGDSISGTTILDSLGAYNLSATGVSYNTGKVGNAIVFGSGANLSRTNYMGSTGTQAFRVKMTAGQTLWAMGNLNYYNTRTRGFQFYINSALSCCMEMGDYGYNTGYHGYTSSAKVNSGTWTHVAFSHSATQTNVFIDGVYRASFSHATISMDTVNPYWFGQRHWTSGGTYSSSGIMIDDIVSTDVRLSDDNILKLAKWGV